MKWKKLIKLNKGFTSFKLFRNWLIIETGPNKDSGFSYDLKEDDRISYIIISYKYPHRNPFYDAGRLYQEQILYFHRLKVFEVRPMFREGAPRILTTKCSFVLRNHILGTVKRIEKYYDK